MVAALIVIRLVEIGAPKQTHESPHLSHYLYENQFCLEWNVISGLK